MNEAEKLIKDTIKNLWYIQSILEFDDSRMIEVDKAICHLLKIYPED